MIVYDVAFSLLLTLYVVPVVYTFVARNTRSPEYISRAIEHLRTVNKKEPVAATLTGSRPERPQGEPLSQEDGG